MVHIKGKSTNKQTDVVGIWGKTNQNLPAFSDINPSKKNGHCLASGIGDSVEGWFRGGEALGLWGQGWREIDKRYNIRLDRTRLTSTEVTGTLVPAGRHMRTRLFWK